MDHIIRIESEKVQLAVQLIDDYTGEVVREETDVFLKGQLKGPVVNPSGYFVFTKIEGQPDLLIIKSRYYYNQEVTIDMADYKEEPLLVIRLIPNTIYPFASKTTLIRGKVKKPLIMFIRGVNNDMALGRLIKPGLAGDQTLNAIKLQGVTYPKMLVCLKHPSEDIKELCVLEDLLTHKGDFFIRSPLKHDFPKGSLLLYAKRVELDERNQFTLYFSQLGALTCAFELTYEEEVMDLIVDEGKVLNIGCVF